MPGYAPGPGGEEFAQSKACFAELEEWLSGPRLGRGRMVGRQPRTLLAADED